MQVICEATQNVNVLVQVGVVHGAGIVWGVLWFIISRESFDPNPSLQLTVVGMKHSDERVALQAVEFWSTVCDEEVELAIEAQ